MCLHVPFLSIERNNLRRLWQRMTQNVPNENLQSSAPSQFETQLRQWKQTTASLLLAMNYVPLKIHYIHGRAILFLFQLTAGKETALQMVFAYVLARITAFAQNLHINIFLATQPFSTTILFSVSRLSRSIWKHFSELSQTSQTLDEITAPINKLPLSSNTDTLSVVI
jgi:hypothetical protein